MSDLDDLKALLARWEVPYRLGVEPVTGDGATQTLDVGGRDHPYKHQNGPVYGYSGFYTCFEFDPEGHFVSMGAWE